MEPGPSKSRSAPRARATPKSPAPARRRASSKALSSQSWAGLLTTLVTSSLGRAILADVLMAAAEALRKERPNLQRMTEQGMRATAQAGDAALEAGDDVAAAAKTMAQSAAGAVAEMATAAARDLLPGSAAKKTKGGGPRTRRRS
jgi:hypothetical protein